MCWICSVLFCQVVAWNKIISIQLIFESRLHQFNKCIWIQIILFHAVTWSIKWSKFNKTFFSVSKVTQHSFFFFFFFKALVKLLEYVWGLLSGYIFQSCTFNCRNTFWLFFFFFLWLPLEAAEASCSWLKTHTSIHTLHGWPPMHKVRTRSFGLHPN